MINEKTRSNDLPTVVFPVAVAEVNSKGIEPVDVIKLKIHNNHCDKAPYASDYFVLHELIYTNYSCLSTPFLPLLADNYQ